MITNADITIYNVKTNKTTKLPEYRRALIRGVHWYTEQKTQVDDKGLHSADVYKIRIPQDADTFKEYVRPDRFKITDDVSDVWTIQNGDIFVKGAVDDEIIKASDILAKYPDCSGRVMSWSDNRTGSQPHLRIGGAS